MSSALVWFRRDLRAYDHAALYHALSCAERVWCVFVFDRDILDPLLARGLTRDRRVDFIQRSIAQLDEILRARGGGLIVRHGRAVEEIPRLAGELGVAEVHYNRDYEPAAIARDQEVQQALAAAGIACHDYKDQVIFDRAEVLNGSGKPYAVFTPYRNAWLATLNEFYLTPYPVERYYARLAKPPTGGVPSLEQLGFAASDLDCARLPPGQDGGQYLLRDFAARIDDYAAQRDYPAKQGPSYLSVHLRFGTISIRQLAGYAVGRMRGRDSEGAKVWLSELIWREFYQMLLWHRPDLPEHCFRREYDALQWDDAPELFAAWCQGRTGYPLVDAAMAQINQTGYMHNRLRMVTAAFLTKDLGIDWRRGEAWFAEQLLDYDLAANNGGWQWSASTGCDAQPWFRIFNPVTQSQKFDPTGAFIRRYVPELAALPDKYVHAPWQLPAAEQARCGFMPGRDYPLPVVDHAKARLRTLARFEAVAKGGGI